MENFFVNDKFYPDLEEYLIDMDLEQEDIEALPDDYTLEAEDTDHEPMFKLDSSELASILDEWHSERKSEDGDEWEEIKEALNKSVDFEKLNANIPCLHYPNGQALIITKSDLLEACY